VAAADEDGEALPPPEQAPTADPASTHEITTSADRRTPPAHAGRAGVGHLDLGRQRNDHHGQLVWVDHQAIP
jgi:hypothetical protein